MAERPYERQYIALQQLETALQLWEASEDNFSVITLAGAAEEILGRCIQARNLPSALDDLKISVAAMYQHLYGEEPDPNLVALRSNYARNQLKHFDVSKSPTLIVDAREEARDMLDRAIDNYWRLESDLTPAMRSFQESAHRAEQLAPAAGCSPGNVDRG